MKMAAEHFIRIYFIRRHGFVGIAHPNIGTFLNAAPGIITGTVGEIESGDLSRANGHIIYVCCGKYGADERGHSFTLCSNLLLKVVQVIYTDRLKILFFIQSKKDNTAVVLI